MNGCFKCGKSKGYRKCVAFEGSICSLCCGTNRNWELCNTECDYFPIEQPNYTPQIVDFGFTEVLRGIKTTFDTPLFLPNVNSLLVCTVNNLEINVLNFNKVLLNINFSLKANRALGNEIYVKDAWKGKESNIPILREKYQAPLVVVYSRSGATSSLVENKYQYNSVSMESVKSSKNYSIWLPFAKSHIGDISVEGRPKFNGAKKTQGKIRQGEMLFAKNDVYFGDIHTQFNYNFSIEISNSDLAINPSGEVVLPFGFFLPFREVHIKHFKINTLNSIEILPNSFLALIVPKKKTEERLFEIPINQNQNSQENHGFQKHLLETLESTYHYDYYLISQYFLFLKTRQEVIATLKVDSNNIVTSYFNIINSVYGVNYSPINLVILNSGKHIQNLEIFFQILGVSELSVKNIHIQPESTLTVSLFPLINESKISDFLEMFTANFEVKVLCNGDSIYHAVEALNILPKETFIYDLEDHGKGWKLTFQSMISRWVTPNTKKIDEIINKVANGLEFINGFSENDDDNKIELKEIYNILASRVKYVNRNFSFYKGTTTIQQKIHLPDNTIANKSGNCLDLTVLFASCLEKLGYDPLIVLIPDHAFLGVKLNNENVFIETTYLGYESFEAAISEATERYNEFFINFHSKVHGLFIDPIIVDIAETRNIGIYPMI